MLEAEEVMMVRDGCDASFDDDAEMQAPGGARKTASAGCETRGGTIDSRAIFGEGNEVTIRHGDQLYRLRITRHGKLILNK